MNSITTNQDKKEKKGTSGRKILVAYLILLNIFALSLVTIFRLNLTEVQSLLYTKSPKKKFTATEKSKLYFSFPQDLAIYYRYAGLFLGEAQDDSPAIHQLGILTYSTLFLGSVPRDLGWLLPNLTYRTSTSSKYRLSKSFSPLEMPSELPTYWLWLQGGMPNFPEMIPDRSFWEDVSDYSLLVHGYPTKKNDADVESGKWILWKHGLRKPASKTGPHGPKSFFFLLPSRHFQFQVNFFEISVQDSSRKNRPPLIIEKPLWPVLKNLFFFHYASSFENYAIDQNINRFSISIHSEKPQPPSPSQFYLVLPPGPNNPGGKLPYRDYLVEYPPLALVPMIFSRMLSDNFHSFAQIFGVLVIIAALIALFLCYSIWKKLPVQDRISESELLLYSFFCLLSIGIVLPTRLDIFPSLLSIIALWALVKKKYYLCTVVLAAATMTKIFPAIFFPALGLTLIAEKKFKTLAGCIALSFVLLLLINVPIYVFSNGLYLDSFAYHAVRPIEIGSFYANIVFLQQLIGGFPAEIIHSFGSTNITNSMESFFNAASRCLPVAVFLGIYLFYFTRILKTPLDGWVRHQINIFLLLILGFIVTCKVLSPQFLIWLFPMILLVQNKRKHLIICLFIIACFLTQMIFPKFFNALQNFDSFSILLLSMRNLILGTILALMFFGVEHGEKESRVNENARKSQHY